MIAAILILSSLVAIVIGYRMFCTGPSGAMRRMSGAVLAIAGVIVLVGFARHHSNARELSAQPAMTPGSLRYLRQERPDTVRFGHDRTAIEKFI
jgi:hypothetical protein